MRITSSLRFLILGCLIIAVGFLSFYFLQAPARHFLAQHSGKSGNSKNTSDQSAEFYKVITDPQTGQYAVVNSNKEIVSLKDKAGNTIWTINVIEATSKYPILGDREIRSMQFDSMELVVRVGKANIQIDKQTGKIIRWGQD
jgi:hypothetical protein